MLISLLSDIIVANYSTGTDDGSKEPIAKLVAVEGFFTFCDIISKIVSGGKIMSEKDLDKKLDLVLHGQKRLTVFIQMLFGWTGLLVGYNVGLNAPTMFVINVSNIIIIFSGSFFIISLIRYIRALKT